MKHFGAAKSFDTADMMIGDITITPSSAKEDVTMKTFAIVTVDPAFDAYFEAICTGDNAEDAKAKYMRERYWERFVSIREI